jgi:hypothetical protein
MVPNETTLEQMENRRREYVDERKTLIELEWRGGDSFVKALTTLSAGALGLSLAFVEKLAPRPQADTLVFLGGAWASFALSLAFVLAGHLTSQCSMRRQRQVEDRAWITQARRFRAADDGSEAEDGVDEPNRWAVATNWLNALSLGVFIAGTVMLALFSWANLPGTRVP